MTKILGKSALTLLLCVVAFGVAYGAVRRASGEGGTGGVGKASSNATSARLTLVATARPWW